MNYIFLITGFILGIILVVIIARFIYQKKLEEILLMCRSLAQGTATASRITVSKKSTGPIAILLNEASRNFSSQLQYLQHEKDKIQAILSSMTEGVIVVGANGRLIHVSPNIRHMLELRSVQWDDRPYWEIIRHQEINDSIKHTLVEKTAYRREIVDITVPKTYFSMQISPVINAVGELMSVVAVLHDITELKQLEHMRAEFVANVSHELKTPLTSIKGYLETLFDAIKDDPASVEKFLTIIKRQTERLENLVNDLLILSSLESSSVKMDFKAESIEKVITSVLQAQKRSIEMAGHELILEIPENLPLVTIDRLRIEQVLINLIDNAAKFTPPKGTLRIKATNQGQMVSVAVSDTGVGIPAEHLARVFERFYRVDKARSRESGGTGLGLSIVHQIITAHQGKVEVNSTPNTGSTFTFFLPIAR